MSPHLGTINMPLPFMHLCKRTHGHAYTTTPFTGSSAFNTFTPSQNEVDLIFDRLAKTLLNPRPTSVAGGDPYTDILRALW